MTVLLFSATNTSVKSWVTSACSMAPTASRAPTSITGASNRPSPVRRGGPPGADGPSAARWRGEQPDDDHDDAGDARHEGEPDPDGPEVGVDHQQTIFPFFPRTRLGYWAM